MDKMEVEEENNSQNYPLQIKISKDNFIPLGTRGLRDAYENTKKLGKGSFGKVFQVRNKTTNKFYACKKISKLNVNSAQFQKEINILMKMDHPNIIKLYEVFESENSIYLIMEECFGGELFDRILKRIKSNSIYTEKEACKIIQQVIGAIEYCHNNGIVHRDLKPENLLYLNAGDEEDNPIKIADFGLSQFLYYNKNLTSKVGTAYYVPPEILAGKYTEKCDIWSSGVILYILLSGEPPFNGSNDNLIYSKIKKIDFNFPEERWRNISNEAKDLISKMIVSEDKRLSASQVLQHPWFNLLKNDKINLQNLKFEKENFFKEYAESNLLKKIMLLYIASRLEENEILDLKNFFKAFDKDNNGQIDYKEFKQGLMELNINNLTKDEIKNVFANIDVDHNGRIDYTEFIAASLERRVYLKKEKLFEAFSNLDKDKDCKISKDEIMKILRLEPKEDPFVAKLINLADKNGDGNIDYKEFLEMMGYSD
jgi:calcium-dependent protein kinase